MLFSDSPLASMGPLFTGGRRKVLMGLCVFLAGAAVVMNMFHSAPDCSSSHNDSPRINAKEALPAVAMARGVLLWSMDGTIMLSPLSPWEPRPLARGENPRWSPDGTAVVFTRDNAVWLMDPLGFSPKKVATDVVTEYGTGAYWTPDGKGIVFISRKDSRKVLLHHPATQSITLVHDEALPPFHNFRLSQAADLRWNNRFLLTFTTDMGHRAMVVDLVKKQYVANELMKQGDCEPAWSPDGRFIVMTRRNRLSMDRPLYIAFFDPKRQTISPSRYLIGKGRCHRSAVANDSRHVVYASGKDLFLWNVETLPSSPQNGIRITTSGTNSDPSLFLFPRGVSLPGS